MLMKRNVLMRDLLLKNLLMNHLLLKQLLMNLLLKNLFIIKVPMDCVMIHINKWKLITSTEDQKESINPDSYKPTLKRNLWIEKYRNWAKKEHQNFSIKPAVTDSAQKFCWKKPKARMELSHSCRQISIQ